MTTLVVSPTFAVPTATTSVSLYQGNGVDTASELASSALPTQLVFDSTVVGNPLGAATTGNAATMSVSPVFVGSAAKSAISITSSTPSETSSPTAAPSSSSKSSAPILPITLSVVAVLLIAAILLFMWYLKRSRRRGHARAGSDEYGAGPPASGVIRKLAYEKPADPFSDANAAELADPFADPEKRHTRTGSDSFLSMGAPRAPYTHAPSASTGSSASSRARKRELEEARRRDMSALNNLVRALDQKDRQAQVEGRDRKSLPPIDLFKAALVR